MPDLEEVNSPNLQPCDPDSDDDGIYDAVELADGTDPHARESALPDSDDDGLSDRYENDVSNTSPLETDSDFDGLNDAQEVFGLGDRIITNPLDADTDDDGILDGNEGGVRGRQGVTRGTDPSNIDTDEDGLTDGVESGLIVAELNEIGESNTDLGLFRADDDPSAQTDPLRADSDGDGLLDGAEDTNLNGARENIESDPLLYDTDNDGMDDGWEVRYSGEEFCAPGVKGRLNPLDPADARQDLDADGLDSLSEYQLLTIEGIESSLKPQFHAIRYR